MPKLAKPLTAIEVKRLTTPGLWPVGTIAGLSLNVKPTGARSWILRTVVGGRRREFGLGAYPAVPLQQAIEAARSMHEGIKAGSDPARERRKQRAEHAKQQEAAAWTFERQAREYVDSKRDGWSNPKHCQQWLNTLEQHAFPHIGAMPVADIDTQHVLACLTPIWKDKTETASRLRQRIEAVLDAATVLKRREGANPARWRGHIDKLLPKPSKVAKVEHLAALPIDDMHGFMKRLREVQGMGARALELAILCAARSGEVRAALWPEFDLDAGMWTVPAAKMKGRREHRVPLSDEAVALLRALPRTKDQELVFPAPRGGMLSDMTLVAVLRRMKVDVTVHGFRSTFRDWAGDHTSFPRELAEVALAHAVGNETEQAYRRSDMVEKRRSMMQAWARFVATEPPKKSNVRPLRAKAA